MPLYTAFCLNFRSAVTLPELLPGRETVDAVIEPADVGPAPHETTQILCEEASASEAVIAWGQVIKARIREGREILYQPYPGVSDEALRLFLLGAGLGVLLHQRGVTVLHGSAVAVNGRVVMFLGDKGQGKSTTAAALYARGHSILTDDLVAVQYLDGQAHVLPAYPQVKLWPEVVEALGSDPEGLARIRPEIDKRVQFMDAGFPAKPLPAACIYILGAGAEQKIIPLPPQVAFMQVMRHLYVSRFGAPFLQVTGQTSLFNLCTQLVQSIPVRVLVRRPDLSCLGEVAGAIEADVKSLD